jgi:hypothetical protein
MRWLGACFVTMLVTGNVFAQSAAPAPRPSSGEARVVRVQIGYICGWCGGFAYRTDLLTVERAFVRRELRDSTDRKTLPNRRERRAITRREWEALLRSIDAKALGALPQDRSCRPCIDMPDSWTVVEYSDGSQISVHYWPGKEPAPVKALKIPDLTVTLFP